MPQEYVTSNAREEVSTLVPEEGLYSVVPIREGAASRSFSTCLYSPFAVLGLLFTFLIVSPFIKSTLYTMTHSASVITEYLFSPPSSRPSSRVVGAAVSQKSLLTAVSSGSVAPEGEVLAAFHTGTPFMFHAGPSYADAATYRREIQQNPLPASLEDYLRKLAPTLDMVHPLRANRTESGIRMYNTWVHEVLRSAHNDIYISEYANVRNWAGNVFNLNEITDESWFLHEPPSESGNIRFETRVVTSFTTRDDEYIFDIGNQEFVDFIAGRVVDALKQGVDVLWMDNSNIGTQPLQVRSLFTGSTGVPTNPRTGQPYTLDEEIWERTNIAAAIRTAVDTAFPSGTEHIILAPNVGHDIVDREWAMVDEYRGVGSEGAGWFAPWRWDKYSTRLWRNQVADLRDTMKRGYPFVYVGKPYDSSQGQWPGRSRLMFFYGSALLGAGYPDDTFIARYNYGSYLDWPGYQVGIGYARGDYFIWPTSTDIYARWFDNALVLVNPATSGSETINPGISYRRFQDTSDQYGTGTGSWKDLGDATRVPIEIRALEAEILFTSEVPDCTGFCSGTSCDGNPNCSTSSGSCPSPDQYCCVGECKDIPRDPASPPGDPFIPVGGGNCEGFCTRKDCLTIPNCSIGFGSCSSGNCCAGGCTVASAVALAADAANNADNINAANLLMEGMCLFQCLPKECGEYDFCTSIDDSFCFNGKCCSGPCIKPPDLLNLPAPPLPPGEEDYANFIVIIGTVGAVASAVAMVWGFVVAIRIGYKLMTSEGDPEKLGAVKEGLTGLLAGIATVVLAGTSLGVIFKTLFGI
jgi:hypothetical protein